MEEALADWSEDDIAKHMDRGYAGYWLTFDAETLAHHARMMREAEITTPLMPPSRTR